MAKDTINTVHGAKAVETAIPEAAYIHCFIAGGGGFVPIAILRARLNARPIRTVAADDEMTNVDHTILADGTSATVEVKLPATPLQGQIHNIFCVDKTSAVTVVGNGNNINGGANTITFAAALNSIMFQFDETYGWAAIGRFIAA